MTGSWGNGVIGAVVACVFFGTNYVPAVSTRMYDGSLFQCFMAVGIVSVALLNHLILFLSSSEEQTLLFLIPQGFLSGVLWATSNYLVLPTVQLLGLGLGFSCYHAINLIVGYLVGRLGLFGVKKEVSELSLVRDLGIAVLLLSFYFVTRVKPTVVRKQDENLSQPLLNDQPKYGTIPTTLTTLSGERQQLPNEENKQFWHPLQHIHIESSTRHVVGVLLAIVAGLFTGVNMTPFVTWYASVSSTSSHPPSPRCFLLSQSLGILLTSIIIVLSYGSISRCYKYAVLVPRFWPAFLGGAMWTVGQIGQISATANLGLAEGYVICAIGPVMVSALVSFFVFHEIQGSSNIFWFVVGLLSQFTGVIMITLGYSKSIQ